MGSKLKWQVPIDPLIHKQGSFPSTTDLTTERIESYLKKVHPNSCFLYIVDEAGKPAGRINILDLNKKDIPKEKTIERPDYLLKLGVSVGFVYKVMQNGGWDELPVVDENGELVGILHRRDLLMHIGLGIKNIREDWKGLEKRKPIRRKFIVTSLISVVVISLLLFLLKKV